MSANSLTLTEILKPYTGGISISGLNFGKITLYLREYNQELHVLVNNVKKSFPIWEAELLWQELNSNNLITDLHVLSQKLFYQNSQANL